MHVEVNFENKTRSYNWETSVCLLYFLGIRCYNTLLFIFHSIVCQVVAYVTLKTKENLKRGRGRLREVVAYRRFQI